MDKVSYVCQCLRVLIDVVFVTFDMYGGIVGIYEWLFNAGKVMGNNTQAHIVEDLRGGTCNVIGVAG